MEKQIHRTTDPIEFELLCLTKGNIEVWLHDEETTVPIRRFRRSEYHDQFEKVRGYLSTFTDDCIIDMQLENDKYNFTHVGSEWNSYFKIDNYNDKLKKSKEILQNSFKEELNIKKNLVGYSAKEVEKLIDYKYFT